MVDSVLILGGGSAGFLAAITIKKRLPALTVTVLRSPSIGIIGVGEATTIAVPKHLHGYLQLDIAEFYRRALPMWKLGIRFIWGRRPYFNYTFGYELDTKYDILPKGTGFYCEDGPTDYTGILSGLMELNCAYERLPNGLPKLTGHVAYHLENEIFVKYLELVAAQLGVIVRDETVQEVLQNDNGITGLKVESGSTLSASLYVDCSGFASVLLGKTLGEPYISFKSSLFCDRAVVGDWERQEQPIQPYTTAETMNSGWCWQIDHEFRINRGYVYSSAWISDSDAEAEFRAKNPKVGPTRIVKFKSGRYERAWVKNVIAIGNSGGFVEPLESTGLAAICGRSQGIAETLADCDRQPNPSMVRHFNKRNSRNWDAIRGFLALHYKFNNRLATPFWQACQADADLSHAAEIVDYYRDNGPSVACRDTLLDPEDLFGMEGYLAMLVGQQVPYHKTYTPSAEDLINWQRIRAHIRKRAMQAVPVPEAFRVIRSPGFVWPEGLYYLRQGANR